jgi:hypothetical protein
LLIKPSASPAVALIVILAGAVKLELVAGVVMFTVVAVFYVLVPPFLINNADA